MRSLIAIALLASLNTPGAAGAQSRFNLSLTPSLPAGHDQGPPRSRQFAMPAVDHVARDGTVGLRRGVVAGIEVGPSATFGLGIFEGAPKRRLGAADPTRPERKSKRAAIGFSLKF